MIRRGFFSEDAGFADEVRSLRDVQTSAAYVPPMISTLPNMRNAKDARDGICAKYGRISRRYLCF